MTSVSLYLALALSTQTLLFFKSVFSILMEKRNFAAEYEKKALYKKFNENGYQASGQLDTGVVTNLLAHMGVDSSILRDPEKSRKLAVDVIREISTYDTGHRNKEGRHEPDVHKCFGTNLFDHSAKEQSENQIQAAERSDSISLEDFRRFLSFR